jgi:OmpA-OmpF porin, OOP family
VPTVNIRPVKDQNMWAPYITTGLGLGLYSNKLGAFLPIGGGLQFNSGNDFYLFVEAQYRASLTPNILPRNLYYSLGFAQKVEFEPRAPKAPKPTLPTKAVASTTADTDGDGIANNIDACPTVKGLAAFKGCPDTDGDGIADSEDKCPTEKGIAKLNGCPIPDSDKDGINDDDDACPTASGVARYKGCPVPDTDKDGINDEEDKCPKEFGVAANGGCPEIAQEAIQKINKAAAEIYFANGSAKLLAKSNASLNDVASFLKANPTYKVNIAGHTDNTGKPEKNKTLSEERANAVKAYLISQGVAADKITAEGFGDEKPIADNSTALGKSINRRVELKVSNY